MTDQYKQPLRQFVVGELVYVPEPVALGDDDELLQAGLDSMGIMRLVMFIEERFGVNLPDDEIEPENVRSLNAIARWIERHR